MIEGVLRHDTKMGKIQQRDEKFHEKTEK